MKSVAVAGVTMLAVTTMLAKGNAGQPTHNVRFTYKVVFTNTGVESGAAGTATASQSINNNSDKETLSVSLKGLQAGEDYSLIADVGGSNIDAIDFTASKNGDAKFTLKNTGTTKNPATLPQALDPLTGVTELDVVNDTANSNSPPTVLTADTTAPGSFTFTDKQTITAASSTNGVTGSLTVSASNRSSKLSLTAAGLTDSTAYVLSLNGSTAGTNTSFTSTSRGTLKINSSTTGNVLDLNEVDLEDTSANVALFFPMP